MASFKVIGDIQGNSVYAFSFFYGGSRAGNKLVMQRFDIHPVASTYEEAMKMRMEVYQQLMVIIKNKYAQDEGGSARIIQFQEKEGLELLKIAIAKAGFTNPVFIVRDVAASEFYVSDQTNDMNFKEENNDGSQKISGDAPKVVYKPFVFEYPNVSIEDPFDQDNWKQTYNILPYKNLNHGGTGRMSGLTCTGQSSQSMEVDSYYAQVSMLQHNEEVNWKHVNWVTESVERFFDEVNFPFIRRFKAVREVARIGAEDDDDAIMKRSFVTFTDKDKVVEGDHNRLLYVGAKINGFEILAMIDNGSGINLMPLSTFLAVCKPRKSLVRETFSIVGATSLGETLGYTTFDLEVGLIRSEIRFDVMDTKLRCHVILGTPWIHEYEGVASTYHQCFKGKFQGKEVVIKASQTPFISYETRLRNSLAQ